MTGQPRKTAAQLVDEAKAVIREISPAEAAGLDGALMVDIRDIRELDRDGRIPGSFHAPRGMLEFWIDPDCKYHKPIFAQQRPIVFFCASGWRSALACRTAMELGLADTYSLAGGFTAWRDTGQAVEGGKPR